MSSIDKRYVNNLKHTNFETILKIAMGNRMKGFNILTGGFGRTVRIWIRIGNASDLITVFFLINVKSHQHQALSILLANMQMIRL
jgi:hypothetical protein